jgi:hypothetical protein
MRRREPLRVKPLTPKMIAKYEAERAFSQNMLAWADACRGRDEDNQEIRQLEKELKRQNKFAVGQDPIIQRRLQLLRDTNRGICSDASISFTLKR